VYQIDSPSR